MASSNPIITEILRQGRGKPKNWVKAALETGRIESNFSNPSGGDRDSAGWRQERRSLYPNPTNIKASVRRFYEEAARLDKGQPSYELAADIQRPAKQFRDRYAAASQEAEKILASGGSSTSSYSSTPITTRTLTTTTAQRPTFDQIGYEDALRKQTLARLFANHPGGSVLTRTGILSTAPVNRAAYEGSKTVSDVAEGLTTSGGRNGLRGASTGLTGPIKITGADPHRLQEPVIRFMKRLAGASGKTITGDSGATHSKYTVNGNISQHTTGDAVDIPASGQELIRLGRLALVLAGMPRKKAMKQTGGLFNVNGHQVIFNTSEGGDHTNHLHYGD